jgi:hypothetical protein
MTFGASKTTATITWTGGRTVYVSGAIHAVSGQRRVCYWGVNGSTDSGNAKCQTAEAGQTVTWHDDPLTIDLPGGVQKIYAIMYIDGYNPVHQVWCTRSTCGTLS